MKKIGILIWFILTMLNFSHAQSKNALSIAAGMSLPNAPAQFYDYWSPGLGGSLQYSSRMEYFYGWSVSAEYNSFSFDAPKFLDHFSIFDLKAEIKGATTNIYSVYGAAEFYLPEFASISVSPFIGLGGLITSVSEAEVIYTYFKTTASSDSKFMLQFPYGIKVRSPLSDELSIFFEAKKNIGFNRLQDKNTDFISIRGGLRIEVN